MRSINIPEGHYPDPDVYEMGTIIFPESLLEQEVNNGQRINFKSIGECKIEVYPNEGTIPHFHLSSKDELFKTCICIYSPHYFNHGIKYQGKLSNKQCELLNSYLKTQSKAAGFTIWDAIRLMWENNTVSTFPDNKKTTKQPDYSRMSQFRDKY